MWGGERDAHEHDLADLVHVLAVHLRDRSEAHGRGLAPSPVHAPPPTARTLLSEALAAPTRVGSAMMDAVTDGLSRLKRHITLRCGWLGRIT